MDGALPPVDGALPLVDGALPPLDGALLTLDGVLRTLDSALRDGFSKTRMSGEVGRHAVVCSKVWRLNGENQEG